MDPSQITASPETLAFVAAITGKTDPAETAAFVAAVTGENRYKARPNATTAGPATNSPSLDEFLAVVRGDSDPAGTAAFVAAITGADNDGHCESRDGKGEGTTDISHAEWMDTVLYGFREPSTAFPAGGLREYNFDPNEPRDEKGRWTTGGSDDSPRNAIPVGPSTTTNFSGNISGQGVLNLNGQGALALTNPSQSASARIDAAFASANQKFPTYGHLIGTDDMDALDNNTRELVEKRNQFLVKSGIFNGHVPAVNIGGESDGELGTHGAINVNIVNLHGGSAYGEPIPSLYLREGNDARLPFANGCVQTLLSKSTPINAPTAKEIARIVAPGGKIILSGPDTPATQGMHKLVIDAVGSRGSVSQTSTPYQGMEDVMALTTTIEVNK